jgi:hypothetical protein
MRTLAKPTNIDRDRDGLQITLEKGSAVVSPGPIASTRSDLRAQGATREDACSQQSEAVNEHSYCFGTAKTAV